MLFYASEARGCFSEKKCIFSFLKEEKTVLIVLTISLGMLMDGIVMFVSFLPVHSMLSSLHAPADREKTVGANRSCLTGKRFCIIMSAAENRRNSDKIP